MKSQMQTRRIKKPLKDFFDKQSLTEWEKSFILGCINSQNRHPQLTHRQWETDCKIEKRYRDVEISRGEEITKR